MRATPEELVEMLRREAPCLEDQGDVGKYGHCCDQEPCSRCKFILAAADLIESEANTAIAVENSKLRILLGDLVEAVDRTEDLDEADGPQFALAMTELEAALSQARPHTEQGLIESLQKKQDGSI